MSTIVVNELKKLSIRFLLLKFQYTIILKDIKVRE